MVISNNIRQVISPYISNSKYQLTYEELRKYIHEIYPEVKSRGMWCTYFYKNDLKPKMIPCNPQLVYKNRGWISWGHFLGTFKMPTITKAKMTYVSYKEAKSLIRTYDIACIKVYYNLKKAGVLPYELPLKPFRFYSKRGWISWSDYLGIDCIANQNKGELYNYETFVEWFIINKIIINSKTEFYNYFKTHLRPSFIPSNPDKAFKNNGWVSWKSFYSKTLT